MVFEDEQDKSKKRPHASMQHSITSMYLKHLFHAILLDKLLIKCIIDEMMNWQCLAREIRYDQWVLLMGLVYSDWSLATQADWLPVMYWLMWCAFRSWRVRNFNFPFRSSMLMMNVQEIIFELIIKRMVCLQCCSCVHWLVHSCIYWSDTIDFRSDL